eukprot:s307_g3.t1
MAVGPSGLAKVEEGDEWMFLQSLPVWMIPVNASAIGCIGWWLTQDWRLLAVTAGFTVLLLQLRLQVISRLGDDPYLFINPYWDIAEAWLSLIPYFTQIFPESQAGQHGSLPIPNNLAYLATAPQLWQCSARSLYPLTFLKLHVVSLYFAAGLCKLGASLKMGRWWANGATLQSLLAPAALFHEATRCALETEGKRRISIQQLQVAARTFVAAAFMFHVVVFAMQGIDFVTFWTPSLLVFVVDPSPLQDGSPMFAVVNNIFSDEVFNWFLMASGDLRSAGHFGVLEWTGPVFKVHELTHEELCKLPFKVLMFGSTEYDSKHRLLDRFIKEDYQHKRFILFSNFRIRPELESKLRQVCHLLVVDRDPLSDPWCRRKLQELCELQRQCVQLFRDDVAAWTVDTIQRQISFLESSGIDVDAGATLAVLGPQLQRISWNATHCGGAPSARTSMLVVGDPPDLRRSHSPQPILGSWLRVRERPTVQGLEVRPRVGEEKTYSSRQRQQQPRQATTLPQRRRSQPPTEPGYQGYKINDEEIEKAKPVVVLTSDKGITTVDADYSDLAHQASGFRARSLLPTLSERPPPTTEGYQSSAPCREAPREEIARVPIKLVLSKDGRGDMGEYTAIALQLIHERYVLQDASFWQPYLDLLPDTAEIGSSFTWSEEDLELLSGSLIQNISSFLREKIQDEYRGLCETTLAKDPARFPLDVFTLPRYIWAYAVLLSRSFRLRFDRKGEKIALVPFVDFINHDPESKAYVAGVTDCTGCTGIDQDDMQSIFLYRGRWPTEMMLLLRLLVLTTEEIGVRREYAVHKTLKEMDLATPVAPDVEERALKALRRLIGEVLSKCPEHLRERDAKLLRDRMAFEALSRKEQYAASHGEAGPCCKAPGAARPGEEHSSPWSQDADSARLSPWAHQLDGVSQCRLRMGAERCAPRAEPAAHKIDFELRSAELCRDHVAVSSWFGKGPHAAQLLIAEAEAQEPVSDLSWAPEKSLS